MEYVIGIDSGGTNYRVRAADLNGHLLDEYTGNTANHYLISEEEVRQRVGHHIDQCLVGFQGQRCDCKYILCGTSGLDSQEDAELLNRIYSNLPGFHCPVTCMNDAELAHYAVTGGYGVLVISGTGAIAYGRNHQGETARVGGWPLSIMGEEGSGSWVSRYALRHLARYFDQAVPDTRLTNMLRQELNITTPKQLADLSAIIAREPEQQPNLGCLVDKAANQGDPWARDILERAAGETLHIVSELIRVLHMEEDEDLTVGIWGSNILESEVHRETFERLLAEAYPDARLRRPVISAIEGAVNLALERLSETNRSLCTPARAGHRIV